MITRIYYLTLVILWFFTIWLTVLVINQTSQQSTQLKYHLQKYELQQRRMDALEVRRDALEKTMVEYMRAIDKKIKKEIN